MIAQVSAVNVYGESGNLMEITVSDGKTSTSHRIPNPVNHLYKQECNHVTCLILLMDKCMCLIFLQLFDTPGW